MFASSEAGPVADAGFTVSACVLLGLSGLRMCLGSKLRAHIYIAPVEGCHSEAQQERCRRVFILHRHHAVPTFRGTPACVLEGLSYGKRICSKGADTFGVWSPVCGARERHWQHDPDQCPTSERADSCGGHACSLQVWSLHAHTPDIWLHPQHAPSSPSMSLLTVHPPTLP